MQLHFKQLGHGEPLVLLHGLFGSADSWFGVAPKLAEKFHIFAPDLRNHGHSPHHPEMDYPLMAADVDKFFSARKIESASVIGHSMGGKVAMQFALDFPARVNKLVVVDMAPRAYARAHDHIFDALLALDLTKFQTRAQIEVVLEPEIPSLTLRRFLLKNLGRDEHGKFFWKMNLRGVAENYAQLGKILCAESRSPGRRCSFAAGSQNTSPLRTRLTSGVIFRRRTSRPLRRRTTGFTPTRRRNLSGWRWIFSDSTGIFPKLVHLY